MAWSFFPVPPPAEADKVLGKGKGKKAKNKVAKSLFQVQQLLYS